MRGIAVVGSRLWIGPALLGAWLLVLAIVPDPRPLGAPEWAVAAVRAVGGFSEPTGRFVATLALRVAGFALLGALVMVASGASRWDARALAAIAVAPVLAAAALWVNLRHLPIAVQIEIAAVSAVVGAVAWRALRGSPLTAAGLLVALGGLFAWGAATGVSDELDAATRTVGRHLLERAGDAPKGDDGFAWLVERAFRFTADSSQGSDPIDANRAAILALSVLLGDERVARVAKREISSSGLADAEALRRHVTLEGRSDWPRHFWVSAGLTLLSDSDRSITVGLSKELMDATSGGSGFSFADLAADAAGNQFTLAATRDDASARAVQARILAGFHRADFVPDLRDLPEGIAREEFHDRYGGVGGAETRRWVEEVRRRLATCAGLR